MKQGWTNDWQKHVTTDYKCTYDATIHVHWTGWWSEYDDNTHLSADNMKKAVILFMGKNPIWWWSEYDDNAPVVAHVVMYVQAHMMTQLHICHRWMIKWHMNMITKRWQYTPVYRQCGEGCSPCGRSGCAPGLSPCRQEKSSAKSKSLVLTQSKFIKEGKSLYCNWRKQKVWEPNCKNRWARWCEKNTTIQAEF